MKRVSKLILAAASAAVAMTPVSVWAQQPPEPNRYGYGPYMMDWNGGWYGMMFFGPVFMILMLAVVIAVAVLLVRWLGGPWHPVQPYHMPAARTPLDLLKERYARGEMDKEEFEERRPRSRRLNFSNLSY